MARGEIDREDVAVLVVVVFQGLDFLMAELGVLARWMGGLWRRYEEGRGFEGGGGVGEASLGRTQERSWRGRAISTASSISAPSSRRSSSSEELLSEDVVQFSSLSSVLSSAARVERVMARGKLGAKEDLKRRLMRFDEREGWTEDDSEYEVSWDLMRCDFRELAPETTSMSDVELCPLPRWVPMVADQRGLLRVVLARLRMNDCRFSCMLRSSLALSSIVRSLLLALSLRGTRRTLFRLLSAPTRNVLDSTNDSCVGGRGKSEGRVLSILVPRVVTEPP
jgi:hypothetical protein